MAAGSGLTFSGLLNAIDGVAAQEGKVLFMTTNHADRLDPALVRPGRVDVQTQFGLASKHATRRLFLRFYLESDCGLTETELTELAAEFAARVPDGVHSMAAVQGHLMRHRQSPAAAAAAPIELARHGAGADARKSRPSKATF